MTKPSRTKTARRIGVRYRVVKFEGALVVTSIDARCLVNSHGSR
jgi:hypothetical protein